MARYVAQRRTTDRPLKPIDEWDQSYVTCVLREMPAFLNSDVASNTLRAYDSAVRRYLRFCQIAGLDARPDPVQLQQFIAALVKANYKLSTIAVTMSGLRRWAADEWGSDSVVDDSGVQRALKVARRLAVQDTRQKLPLSAEDLIKVVRHLASAKSLAAYTAVRDSAMFVIGWAGMLRSSEIVGLEWRDVHFTRHGELMLHLPKTKTDPGAGSWVLLASSEASMICPATSLRALKMLSGDAQAVGPVFKPFLAASSALAKTTVACRLKKALASAGICDANLYAAHSLRRGGATHAAKVGIPLRFIKLMGRWRSDAVREYLYASPELVMQQSKRMLAV